MAARDFGDRQLLSLANIFLGPQIGSGIARRTFIMRTHPEYVVKVEEENNRDWQNIAEWDLWQNAGLKLQKFLAPCIFISDDGLVLIQRKCEPMPRHLIPAKVPSLLTDTHSGNWGWLSMEEGRKGRPVLFDYGRHLAFYIAQNAGMKTTERYGSQYGTHA